VSASRPWHPLDPRVLASAKRVTERLMRHAVLLCRRCGENEARYTTGLCGVCDVLEGGGGVRLSDLENGGEK